TGSGKEVVARAIYDSNPTGNFVPIDCGSMVGPLMESELFGHAKGAFTGASESKKGLIEHANGGTAFFDEIGDLPLDLQVKLLRVLQEREYRPVGSVHRHKVSLRVIAATHRDLALEVQRGTFRQDLYFRLNVITVRIPSLRERKEDILPLIAHFLTRMNAGYSLTREAQDAILSYEWPGNVRELGNCVQRMTAMNSGPLLHTADLPSSVQNHMEMSRGEQKIMAVAARAGSASRKIASAPGPVASVTGIMPLTELEKRAIFEAIEYTKGDYSMAAHLLGIGRTTLYRKLRQYKNVESLGDAQPPEHELA
ncbi:MAG: sigma-54 dependent transcriptional regulator, partial [Bryobacteraceae bacterium]